jgi:hypothetical protein
LSLLCYLTCLVEQLTDGGLEFVEVDRLAQAPKDFRDLGPPDANSPG